MEMEYKLGLYQAPEGGIVFDVDTKAETMWATQIQIAQIFDVDKTVISRHLRNIYQEGELSEKETCQKRHELRKEGERQVQREVKRYNLDAIISVGYRVSSAKATKFRIWSTKVLKEYIKSGVVTNEAQLAKLSEQESVRKIEEIKGAMAIIERVLSQNELSGGEANGVIEIITRYTKSFQMIGEYLKGQFKLSSGRRSKHDLSGVEIENLVLDLRERMGEDEAFGTLKKSCPNFEDLAEKIRRENLDSDSVTKKAAKLLYLIVREEPFLKGNQQIGGLLFVVYLAFNQVKLSEIGETKISDRALTALVLLIAESVKDEKELLLNLICRLLDN